MASARDYVLFKREVDRIVDKAVEQLSKLISQYRGPGNFDITHPSVRSDAERIIRQLRQDLERFIQVNSNQRWRNGLEIMKQGMEDARRKANIPVDEYRRMFQYDPSKFAAFMERRIGGKRISDRVWNVGAHLLREFEFTVDTGINSGIPATELARDLKKYLREPNRLYRRVRDADGKLRLSAAAKAYSPGQGVYRSSYQNAFRLARTETNMAFHEATYQKAQELDFIVGITIVVTNDEITCDICDLLQGDYPKAFKFSGWHPQCRCSQVMILKTDDEFVSSDRSKPSKREVVDLPDGFKSYVKSYPERVAKTYFGMDNKKLIKKLVGITI